ncbi:electron transport complex subunit D [Oscillospiraceae bacterium]|nr:electron transport complex subunit D [Oscillospiraceae bacterium]BDF73983.1 electron transport complex subunit D [Oscillospiraceae bacterium]
MNSENKIELKLSVASSPHVCSPMDTTKLMLNVILALIPALCIAVYFFGPRALTVTVVSVLGCEFFEWGYRKLLHKPSAVADCSAPVTGILLAFVCPVTIPYWMLLIGDFFAIVVVKQLFGGLGRNFMNPALGGRAFLMLSYLSTMTKWAVPGTDNWAPIGAVGQDYIDAFTSATPLATMHPHLDVATGLTTLGLPEGTSLVDLFVGSVGGCLGEVSALLLLLGGVYLIWRGIIHARIPVSFIGTVAVLTFIFSRGQPHFEWMMYNLLSGGLFLGAFFMATDYTTSPVTKKGEVIFGVGCGVLTVFIRYFGAYPEGVSYAILIMNVCVWLIDKVGAPNRYGVTAEARKAAKEAKKAAKKEAGAQ